MLIYHLGPALTMVSVHELGGLTVGRCPPPLTGGGAPFGRIQTISGALYFPSFLSESP